MDQLDTGERPQSPLRAVLSRRFSLFLGVILVSACLLASIAALSFFLLLIGQNSGSAVLSSPEDALLTLLGGVFTLILIGIAIRYAYYYYCWFVSRRYFLRPPAIDLARLSARDLPNLTFQVTTKGGALPVVERSLRVLENACDSHAWLKARVTAEVITERPDEADYLQKAFAGTSLAFSAIALPPDYSTPNGSRLKARALHYMVELRRERFNTRRARTYIVHLDEETVITEPHVMVLLDYLSKDPKPISQGPILYPLEWAQTPWVCRAIESTRPFGCSECARVMQHPPPPHLHGSNLVVEEAVENEVGWDFGTLDGQPFVAEDLLFGLRAYALLGADAFGWHGATALEQPPLSLFWAVQQRLRWVLGALQGLRAMWVHSDYRRMSRRKKLRLSLSVYSRIATYSLGFPIGLTGLVFAIHPLHDVPGARSPYFALRAGLLLSAVAWLVSYQIGMRRNLLYQSMPWWEKAYQHAVMLVITPVVGLCETVGPFVALVRWLFGLRGAQWTPTPKLADRPAVAEKAPAGEPEPAMTPAPMPAWLLAMRSTPSTTTAPGTSRAPTPSGPAIGAARALTALSATVLVFIVYEFMVTGLFFDRSQQSLLTTFKENIRTTVPSSSNARPAEGDPIALIKIPRIGLDRVVVEGSTPEDLKDGPGHFRGSPMPGEFGNVVLVGRRTTYGAPFRDLDHLVKGDRFSVTTSQGSFSYQVTDVHHTGAGKADPLNGTLDSRLTLITSDPAYVPDGRLAVVAKLRGDPIAVPNRPQVPISPTELGFAGDNLGLGLGLFWALLLAAAVWVAWRVARTWPTRVRHLLATPVLVALVVLVFSSLDRVLPSTM